MRVQQCGRRACRLCPLGKMLADQAEGTEVDRADGGRRARSDGQGAPVRFRGGRPDVGPGVSDGAGRDSGCEVRDRHHQARSAGPGRPCRCGRPSSTSTRAAWRRCRASTPSPRSASCPAASSRGCRGSCCTCTTRRPQFTTIIAWTISFAGRGRGQMAITSQMIYASLPWTHCRINSRRHWLPRKPNAPEAADRSGMAALPRGDLDQRTQTARPVRGWCCGRSCGCRSASPGARRSKRGAPAASGDARRPVARLCHRPRQQSGRRRHPERALHRPVARCAPASNSVSAHRGASRTAGSG